MTFKACVNTQPLVYLSCGIQLEECMYPYYSSFNALPSAVTVKSKLLMLRILFESSKQVGQVSHD